MLCKICEVYWLIPGCQCSQAAKLVGVAQDIVETESWEQMVYHCIRVTKQNKGPPMFTNTTEDYEKRYKTLGMILHKPQDKVNHRKLLDLVGVPDEYIYQRNDDGKRGPTALSQRLSRWLKKVFPETKPLSSLESPASSAISTTSTAIAYQRMMQKSLKKGILYF